MECPKCRFDHQDQTTECLKCGLVFAKYARSQEAMKGIEIQADDEQPEPLTLQELGQESRFRLLAIPAALLAAGLLVWSPLGPMARLVLSMWVHESGHAVTAWLCGFGAFPGPWRTPVSSERIILVSVALAAGLGWCVYKGWRARSLTLAVGGAVLLVIQLICTFLPDSQANALISFGGDAGCLVLGSILMATFYVRRESAIYRGALRWGFLVFGAVAFMDAFRTWWGARYDLDRIPFGEIEGVGLSDPSRLTDEFGWAVQTMIQRYVWLGVACLVAITVVYIIGILQVRADIRAKEKRKRLELVRTEMLKI